MTTTQKNERIAHLAGWRSIEKDSIGLTGVFNDGPRWRIPNYFNDIVAIRELSKTLKGRQRQRYIDAILPPEDTRIPYDELWFFLNATAHHRAEALGIALGLWTKGD